MKSKLSKYDLNTKRKVYEMLGEYGNDINKLLTDLENLQEIQQRLGRKEYFRDEIKDDELELLCTLNENQIEELR